ncbi:MAG: apolipoprotein N-acyltransferase [Burkholderiaceae bacterium]|jgi:apolipoprotein N-acyltransferase|nr:apolipoprotein N-acyltransferase [Burkholderiaceae bacterium]
MRLTHWLARPAASLLAGVAQAACIADPFSGQPRWWLQVLSLAVLAWLLAHHAQRLRACEKTRHARSWRGGFGIGWLFGLGWLAGTFWWLFISLHTYGGLPAPLAVAAVLALAGFLALYYGLAGAVFVALALRVRQPMPCAFGFAALWTLAELLRGTLLTGFPWGASGYAHVDGPLAFLARYVGVYGLGFVAAALAGLLALSSHIDWRGPRVLAAAVVVALAGAGLWGWRWHDLNDGATLLPATAVALLQGNIPQDEKFIPGTGIAESLSWYGEQLHTVDAPLVVAPETALPVLLEELPEGYWQALLERYARSESVNELGRAALLGVPLGDPQRGYTNSVLGLTGNQAAPYRYDKHHLVPFGEFVPPLFKWFVRMMNIPLGDFMRGPLRQPSFAWQSQRLAPNICYEDLFGEELAARFVDPAGAPTAFVNVGNIAWFGDTVAIDQHLHISRMRALEFERPMLRATNTGATAIIDHRGQVTHLLPRLTRAVLTGSFQGRTHTTPYARWAAVWGLWPLAAACALLVATLGLARRKHPAV